MRILFIKKLIVLFTILLLGSTFSFAQSTIDIPSDSTSSKIQALELSEISSETSRLNEVIQKMGVFLNDLSELSQIEERLLNEAENIDKLTEETNQIIQSGASIVSLRELKDNWDRVGRTLDTEEKRMANIFSQLALNKSNLEGEKLVWSTTLTALDNQDINDVVLSSIEHNIVSIDSVLLDMNDSTNAGLGINDVIFRLREKIQTNRSQIEIIENDQLSGIFVRDQYPIWNHVSSPHDTVASIEIIKLYYFGIKNSAIEVFKKQTDRALIHVLIFLGLIGFFFYLNFNYHRWELFQLEELKPTTQFIKSPLTTSIFLTFFTSFWIYNYIPVSLAELTALFSIVPLFFVLSQLISKKVHASIYILGLVALLDQLHGVLGNTTLLSRWIVVVEIVLSITSFIILYRGIKEDSKTQPSKHRVFSFLTPLIPICIILLFSAFIGVVRGNTVYAFYIIHGVTLSSLGLFVFFVIFIMSKGTLALALFGSISQGSNIIRLNKNKLYRSSTTIVKVFVTFLWLRYTSKQFGFYSITKDYFADVADKSWQFGKVSISIGNLLDGILVMVVAWYLGLFLRSLLKDEILPRFQLQRGLPSAIGISVRYFVLTMGFFLAVASLGIDLEKLGFIAGALSVGIGFGLQNIVGNFISGLILLFERPVVIGDIIELNELQGVVLNIGLRSSTVKTWEGAEVIIPNMDLISKQVTNLTLSDKKRRMEIVFETEKDAPPKEIIKVISSKISLNQEILGDPSPRVLFKGEIRNFYRFRALFWVTGNVLEINSDVLINISETLAELGVKMAIPESKINLSESKFDHSSGK